MKGKDATGSLSQLEFGGIADALAAAEAGHRARHARGGDTWLPC